MEALIKEKLHEIEQRENCRILLAVESGSRAWGFASPDSDYDVRFIYVRPRESYLRLNRVRDVIELPINGVLDINGWDVDKTLKLLHKSNPTVFEWFSSPIVYQTTDFTEAFKPVMRRYFSSKSGLWHYLQMAEGNYREYLRGDMVKAKKYFYVLRPILACRWILEKGTPPPMLFSELAASQLPDYLEKTVAKLLDLKMNSPEVKMIPRIDILNAYMDRSIAEVRALVEQYPREITKDWEELNALFLAALEMKLPPQVNTAFEMLEAAGYEAYLVGGAVRDYVRDNSPAKDWDITTNALPEQVEEIFTGYHLIETGLKHGTVTVVIDQEPLEITTYRVDGDYSDHRHPDSVSFTRSLKDDLERRDFTMNALAYNPRTGVVDFVGGKADIAGDLVRCVGDPDRRFQEDGLRMLRALRFASVYGMTIEAATATAIHRNKHLLKGIAAERILVELTKMLCAQGAAGVLRDFADVLAVPIPELTPMFGFPQHNPHHDKDVWDHTIAVIESITPEPVLRWAALLHDIGKPSCFSLAEDGIGHFFGHSDQSTSMAESILSRLRFDNASKEQIVRLVRYHDMPITADRKPIKRLLSKHGEDATRQLIELHKADTLGQSAICRHRIAIFEEVSQMINEILQEESCFTLKDLAVNGHDMMTLGFQGPTIGRVLQECLDAVLDEQIPNEHEALMAFAKDRQLKS